MTPESREIAERAIEGGLLDEECEAYANCGGGSPEEVAAFASAARKLTELTGEPARVVRHYDEQGEPDNFFRAIVWRARGNVGGWVTKGSR